MKKLTYLSTAIALVFTLACGGNTENTDSQDEGMTEGTDQAIEEMESEEDKNEREITVQELPESVASSVRSSYEDYMIDEIEEITANDGVITYEIELKKDGEEIDVIYSAEGQFLGIEEEDDDDDAEDDDDEGNNPE